MKLSRLAVLHLVALLAAALATLPCYAQDLGEVISSPGIFSYQAPKGWEIKTVSYSKYQVCYDAPKSQFQANINVVLEKAPVTLDKFVEVNETVLKGSTVFKNFQVIDEKPFTGAAGAVGTRVVVKDTLNGADLQQIFYFFTGKNDAKFVVTASSLAADEAYYAPIFDASLKTFSPQ